MSIGFYQRKVDVSKSVVAAMGFTVKYRLANNFNPETNYFLKNQRFLHFLSCIV